MIQLHKQQTNTDHRLVYIDGQLWFCSLSQFENMTEARRAYTWDKNVEITHDDNED